MRYNVVKNLCKMSLALAIMLYGVNFTYAQGTVSFADDFDAEFDDGNNIPDEISLFSNNGVDDSYSENNNELLSPPADTKSMATNDNTISLNEDNVDLEKYGKDDTANSVFGEVVKPSPVVIDDNFGEDILKQIDDTLFSQMSDIEKQTALLTLELRRERIKTEIEAIRLQRQRAMEAEDDVREQKERQKKEWENEEQRKLIIEQTKLQEEAFKLEQLRQERVINAYKNEMLKANQKWVASLSEAYKSTKAIEDERKEFLNDFKNKMSSLATIASKVREEAVTAKENYDREILNLQTQISVLNTRLENIASEQAIAAQSARAVSDDADNPFAKQFSLGDETSGKALSDEYMILEVRGKGDDITAKISNRFGLDAFFARKGTRLKTGHIIDEITTTSIRADKNGEKDYLYFSAGGVLDKEPDVGIGGDSEQAEASTTYQSKKSSKDDKNRVMNVSDNFLDQMFVD